MKLMELIASVQKPDAKTTTSDQDVALDAVLVSFFDVVDGQQSSPVVVAPEIAETTATASKEALLSPEIALGESPMVANTALFQGPRTGQALPNNPDPNQATAAIPDPDATLIVHPNGVEIKNPALGVTSKTTPFAPQIQSVVADNKDAITTTSATVAKNGVAIEPIPAIQALPQQKDAAVGLQQSLPPTGNSNNSVQNAPLLVADIARPPHDDVPQQIRLTNRDVGTATQVVSPTRPQAEPFNVPVNAVPTVGSEPIQQSLDPITPRFDGQSDLRIASPSTMIAQASTQISAPQKAIVHQVVAALSKPVEGAVQIRLDPPELGRIVLHITATDVGNMAVVSADKPEILDLMRRNENLLNAELETAGYSDLSFEFSQHSTPEDTDKEPETPVLLAGAENASSIDVQSENEPGQNIPVGQTTLDIRL